MDQETVSPVAARIIEMCGGVATVAAFLGMSQSSVYKWTHARSKGGTGGVVPAHRQQELLDIARKNEIDLRPEHFFHKT